MADWTPEVVIGPDEARERLAEAFPALAGAPLRLLGAGFDNTAYAVGDWIVRFPRRAIAVALLEQETRLLPVLAGRLPVAVPVPAPLVRPSQGFPFAAYPALAGQTGCEADPATRRALGPAVGRFLAALHQLPPVGVGPDPMDRANFAVRGPRLLSRLADFPEFTTGASEIADLATTTPWAGAPRWVHGDFYPRHLLIHEGALAGVIDWGDTHAGDPALDLAILYTLPGEEGPAPILEAYEATSGSVDPPTLRRARFHAWRYLLAFAGYYRDTGDAGMGRMAEWTAKNLGLRL